MSNAVYPALPGLTFDTGRNPKFNTRIHQAVSGRESRAAFMQYPLWEFTLAYDFIRDNATDAELESLLGFFLSRNGSFDSFLFDCPEDNAVTNETFGTGDGTTEAFQLYKTYGGFSEDVHNPKSAPSIYVDGVLKTVTTDYAISSTGLVTFVSAPANLKTLSWTGGFYYRCRFAQDITEFNQFMSDLYELGQIRFIGSPLNKV
jgi:uncharacterized protein (TIGR02217 family)